MPLTTATTPTTATMKSNGIVHFGTEQQQQLSDENQHHQRSIKRQRNNNNKNDNRLMNGGPPLLCLGGTRGIIKIIDTTKQSLHITLSGHGNDITDLKFSPTNEYYLLSSSKDESIRLWNISSPSSQYGKGGCGGGGVNLAIFAGHVGHRGQVVSIGWHISGKQFVSGGMDNMIKLWNIGDDDTATTTATKTNDDNSCSNRNVNNNNATTTTATATTSNATDQSVIPSNWSNDIDGSCSRSSSRVRIPSTTIQQQQQYSRQERDVRTTTFDTVFQQFPYFSTNKVHTNYVGKCFYK
jgi:WD40 repeat protein